MNIKVKGICYLKEVPKVLIRVFRTKPVECASALHQPDGVGSQGCHIGSVVELNGVSIALVARSGILS